MADQDHIPMPSKAERDASIQAVLDQGLSPTRPSWRNIPLSVLVFGVEDCLFLAAILGGLCFFSAMPLAQEQHYALSALLFVVSPALYAALQVLTAWKDSQSGTLEWKRTCRVSPRTVAALRMLAFGGAASAACLPLDVLVWALSGGRLSLPRLLGLSFAGLFVYAALTLLCQKALRRGGILLPPLLWAALGAGLLRWRQGLAVLDGIPTLVFALAAAAALACCLGEVRQAVRYPNRGGFSYALR